MKTSFIYNFFMKNNKILKYLFIDENLGVLTHIQT